MNIKLLPNVDYLRTCFNYNPESGELRWKKRPVSHFSTKNSWSIWNSKHAGTIAGNIDPNGYRCVGINRRLYKAHRLIWKIFTGNEPPPGIDHHDGNTLNNEWRNLREADQLQQNWNARLKKNNTSGYRGVSKVGSGRYGAQIRVNRKYRYLGTFDTPEEASAAYQAAAKELHGEFFRQ